ncbi:phage tail tape measure protein, partial [Aquabacterium sp.]|uniref:phage tail tape measure protein n=1 Tax=Aquabacterium sp. TaxID=1872578 RepID=UPI0025C5E05E
SRMSSVLDVTVEQAGTDIGKIASIFKVPMADIERAVSTFNQVSNNSTASGEQLLDVVKRIGDAAGSLDLAKSTAIAASGIDLGFSPEVVGSNMQKIFSEMYARAEGFQKLLGGTVNGWIARVQSDGLGALKEYVAALRKLAPDVQQQQIKMLSGGGRISALLTKYVQDTEDTILDRNYKEALAGFTEGTSAIKEQKTVLATLDAAIDQAGNSFQALGIKAGQVFGPRLTAYFNELNKQLANPEILNFAKAVGGAFLDLFDTVVTGVKYINSLNLNWYNFITLAKVFLGLKLVQSIANMAAKIPLLGTAWSSLAGSAAAAGEAQVAAGGAGAGALQTQVDRVKALIAQHKAYQTTLKEEAAFTAQVAQNEAKLAAAQVKRENMRGLENQGKVAIVQAGTAVTTAKQGVSTATTNAAAAQAAVQTELNAKLEAAALAHSSKMQAIEYERIQMTARAVGAGNAAMEKAAQLSYQEQIAAETSRNNRSIAGLNSYYARRLRIVTEAGAAEVAAANAALMASLSAFDGVAAGVGMTALQANSAAAAAAVGKATVNLDASRQSLTLAQRAAVLAGEG